MCVMIIFGSKFIAKGENKGWPTQQALPFFFFFFDVSADYSIMVLVVE